jgi:PAS domain S-box-containing protein
MLVDFVGCYFLISGNESPEVSRTPKGIVVSRYEDSMSPIRIQIVEDERLLAEAMKQSLEKAGFKILSVVPSGVEAIQKAEADHPDVVLMDIVLRGRIDGIEAAQDIQGRLEIPVIFVTGYTIDRAKAIKPFGYLLKPFAENELIDAVNQAIERHRIETRLRESETWLSNTLKSLSEGVIATDTKGRIHWMNQAAETLTGWTREESVGQPIDRIFKAVDESSGKAFSLRKLDDESISGDLDKLILVSREKKKTPIQLSKAPIKNDREQVVGAVHVFQNISERKRVEEELRQSLGEKEKLLNYIHERVEHSLRIISTLILIQSRKVEGQTAQLFRSFQDRIRSMSLIYEELSHSKTMDKVPSREYLENLVGELFGSHSVNPGAIRPVFHVDDIAFGIDIMVPVGLIVTELVSNVIHHAFPNTPQKPQLVEIILRREKGKILLSVADQGVGLPESFSLEKSTSLGLSLVRFLVDDLNGTLKQISGNGTHWFVTFKEIT